MPKKRSLAWMWSHSRTTESRLYFRSDMNLRNTARAAVAMTLLGTFFGVSAVAEPPSRPLDAARLLRAVERLGVVVNVLYVAAHPDDENTRLLGYLHGERLLR